MRQTGRCRVRRRTRPHDLRPSGMPPRRPPTAAGGPAPLPPPSRSGALEPHVQRARAGRAGVRGAPSAASRRSATRCGQRHRAVRSTPVSSPVAVIAAAGRVARFRLRDPRMIRTLSCTAQVDSELWRGCARWSRLSRDSSASSWPVEVAGPVRRPRAACGWHDPGWADRVSAESFTLGVRADATDDLTVKKTRRSSCGFAYWWSSSGVLAAVVVAADPLVECAGGDVGARDPRAGCLAGAAIGPLSRRYRR